MQLRIAVGIVSCCLLSANSVRAQQVSADGTTSTSVTSPDGSNFKIEDGDRAGSNLFHSFSEFSVPTGGSAFFNNDLDVKNIISRVTGGKISNIDGLIRANGSANLFLLNPSGIIFGDNASLNIGGSFISSTANSLKFADGIEFSATDASSPPLLTVSVPVGLQYGTNAANINVQHSSLAVQPQQTLVLAGGNVTIAGGNLTAPNGRIELGAVAGAGTVGIANVDNQLQLSFPDNIQTADLAIADAANVSASGSGGGDIQLTGRRITVERSRVEANTFGSQPGGNFNVNASESLELIGNEPGELFDSGLFAETFDTGNSGNLSISTGKLIVRGDARISTATWSAGNGGNLSVKAADSVEVVGVDPPDDENLGLLFTGLLTDAYSTGAAGNLTIQTTRLRVRDGGRITATTFGAGNGGNITVNASQSVELIGTSPSELIASGLFNPVQTTGTGNAADLTVNTGRLTILAGAKIFTGTAGGGNGGNLTINAPESVEVIGVTPSEEDSSGLFTTVGPQSKGNAGDLIVNTKRLIVSDGGQVSANTSGFGNGGKLTVNAPESVELIGVTPSDRRSSGLYTSVAATSTGNAGDLIVNTGRLIVRDGAQILAGTLGVGNGGNLAVNASESIELTGVSPIALFPSGLFSGTEDFYINQQELIAGNAGEIKVNTGRLIVRDGAKIQAASRGNAGQAGNLTVNAREFVELSGQPPDGAIGGRTGLVSNTVNESMPGNGTVNTSNSGSVTVNTEQLIVRDGAQIAVNNEGTGKGGELKINARSLLLDNPKTTDNTGTLTAATASGDGGNINLNQLNLLLMRQDSKISAEAGDFGTGGNIKINTNLLVALDNSEIVTNAFKGNGGNIQIGTQGLFRSPNTRISASSEFGVNGVVDIRSPVVDPSKGLVSLPQEVVNVTGLVAQGCTAARNYASSSSFVITGRGGLPPNPNNTIASETVLADLGSAVVPSGSKNSGGAISTRPPNPSPTQIVEAQGWMVNKNGQVFLTANPPAVTLDSFVTAARCSGQHQP